MTCVSAWIAVGNGNGVDAGECNQASRVVHGNELGHFLAAKAAGMRVERFELFFPPLIARKTLGETEYAIGAIPLDGYVKIIGMSPNEEIPPDLEPRAY